MTTFQISWCTASFNNELIIIIELLSKQILTAIVWYEIYNWNPIALFFCICLNVTCLVKKPLHWSYHNIICRLCFDDISKKYYLKFQFPSLIHSQGIFLIWFKHLHAFFSRCGSNYFRSTPCLFWTDWNFIQMMRLTGSDLLDISHKCPISLNSGMFAFLYFSSSTASNETRPVHRRDILKTV